MTAAGFDKPLYILAIDQSGSSQAERLGRLALENTEQTGSAEQVIYEGFKAAIETGVPKAKAGILASEECGGAILHDAAMHGYLAVGCAGNMEHEEFEFEHGEQFQRQVETLRPIFCNVRVRYNPGGDKPLNRWQAARLRRLSEYLRRDTQSLFLCELLPPKTLRDRLRADLRPDGADVRVSRIVGALEELQNARIEPDVWGIEALDSAQEYEQIIAAARRGGRKQVGCIIQGRGQDQLSLRRRLAAAAAVEGFIGFVVGRACFEDPLLAWGHGKIARAEAVALIAYRYRRCAEVFEERVCAAA